MGLPGIVPGNIDDHRQSRHNALLRFRKAIAAQGKDERAGAVEVIANFVQADFSQDIKGKSRTERGEHP